MIYEVEGFFEVYQDCSGCSAPIQRALPSMKHCSQCVSCGSVSSASKLLWVKLGFQYGYRPNQVCQVFRSRFIDFDFVSK